VGGRLPERLAPRLGRDLAAASAAFVVANMLHTADHFRQGTERLAAEVVAGGTVLSVAALVTLALALKGHPRAALSAAVVGLSGAAGVVASHLAPHWSAFSDPYPQIDPDLLSWAAMLAEVAAALALALVGWRELRRRDTGPATEAAGTA
jgi:hypothetical protein